MMQAKWGSHGDYEIIALCPNSPQECFDLTIEALNLSERWRVPVLLMMDECVGHMTEKVIIPPADEIEIVPREYSNVPPEEYLPYAANKNLVPELVPLGKGYHFHTTGLTHDERGYPVMTAEAQEKCVHRLIDKIKKNADKIYHIEKNELDDAEVVMISYGISSRVAIPAVEKARREGIKVGELRLVTVWPFPEELIRELADSVAAFVVPEINYGQVVLEVERCAGGKAITKLVPHGGGWVHDPEAIYQAIREVVR